MQERTAVLVDFFDFTTKITNTFDFLKKNHGRDLNLLLSEVKCDGEICETIEKYYAAEELLYSGIPLLDDKAESKVPLLTEIREKFLNSMIDQIKSYFPSSDLNVFKIFRPADIPGDVGQSLTYGVLEIKKLCAMFKLGECSELLNDWAKLLESIIENENFCSLRNSKTETYAFWSKYLNENGISWTTKTIKLVQIILVIPIGSADAERGFSIMNHLQSSRRSKLTPKHMEDIMRIRLNGADDLEKFPASKYAKKWVDENHLRTDDPRNQRSKVLTLFSGDELKKKYLPKLSFL